jgi:hypothetical protein
MSLRFRALSTHRDGLHFRRGHQRRHRKDVLVLIVRSIRVRLRSAVLRNLPMDHHRRFFVAPNHAMASM